MLTPINSLLAHEGIKTLPTADFQNLRYANDLKLNYGRSPFSQIYRLLEALEIKLGVYDEEDIFDRRYMPKFHTVLIGKLRKNDANTNK